MMVLLKFRSIMTSREINHDRNFKNLISTFFIEFLELFLPELAQKIDPQSVKFLKQQYFTDLTEGEEKIIDLLAEVRIAGDDATFLIHIEPQSTNRANFAKRMFLYFAVLHQQQDQPIYPIAVFSYDQPAKVAESCYKVEIADLKVLEFNFTAIQLNRLDWRDYLNRPNPVAAALMAKMRIDPTDRPKVKAQCLRLMVTLKLDPARSRLIAQFVDDYLRLDETEEQTFQVELDRLEASEKEAIMQATTSWEEKGIEQGIEKATQAIALNMLKDNLPLAQIVRLTGLTIEQIQVLQMRSENN
jgi:predicted transposase YdaD